MIGPLQRTMPGGSGNSLLRGMVALVPLSRTDGWLWIAVGVLTGLGLVLVRSATIETADEPLITATVMRQLMYLGAGITGMFRWARLDYRWLRRIAPVAFLLAALLLVLVLFAGTSEYGARRWLGAGAFTIQPSEFAKLALALALAAYATGRPPTLAAVLIAGCITAIVAALVAVEPDLGSALATSGVWLVLIVAWGARARVLGGLLGTLLGVLPLAFAIAVPAYQRERLAVFFDPSHDPLGSGFNQRLVEIAIGSGGGTGRGLFGASESTLSPVAARSSDFIFALLGEELGLLGTGLLLAMVALAAWRGLEIARTAPDAFGRLLATALTAMIVMQACLNIAVNLRLVPATGIPLPFISQGGSALVAMLLAVGLLQSIARQRPVRHSRWAG